MSRTYRAQRVRGGLCMRVDGVKDVKEYTRIIAEQIMCYPFFYVLYVSDTLLSTWTWTDTSHSNIPHVSFHVGANLQHVGGHHDASRHRTKHDQLPHRQLYSHVKNNTFKNTMSKRILLQYLLFDSLKA